MSILTKQKKLLRRGSTVATLAFLVLHAAPIWAQSDTAAPTLEDVDQKVRILQRQLEVADEINAGKPPAPTVSADADGFVIKSPDGNFVLKSRGLLQVDYRGYLNENDTANEHAYLTKYPNNFPNTFVLRKVRPIWDASFGKYYSFRLVPDFGGGTVALMDAYGEVNLRPELRLRAGKFTPPIGLERIQASSDNLFVEYGLPASFAPQRDLGVQLFGDVLGGTFSYAVGVFNGAADGANKDNDSTDHKDVTGRVFVQPFKTTDIDFLRTLGVGLSANWGQSWGDSVNSNLSSYKTTGQNTYFSYRTGTKDSLTVHAAGDHYRLNPQGYWAVGPVSFLSEYLFESQRVLVNKTKSTSLHNQAGLFTATWVLTGDHPSFTSVKPRHPFALDGSGIGAVELVARAGILNIDDKAFPIYADSTKSARQAESFGAGVNWYLSNQAKLVFDYELTKFKGGAVVGNRDDENVYVARLQLNF